MTKTILSVTADDGAHIRVEKAEPTGAVETTEASATSTSRKPLGVIQMIHGFGEGIEHYDGLVEFFTANGYACVIHDQRGHGKMPDLTPAQRKKALGVVPDYTSYLSDVKVLREKIGEWYPGIPVILYGHSMGGNIAANYLLKTPQSQYSKVILESPWFRMAKPLPKILTPIARFLGRISPTFTVNAGLHPEDTSRNLEQIEMFRNDGIYHGKMSFRLYPEILDAGEYAIARAAKITLPTLLLIGGDDKIVSAEAEREFAKNGGDNITVKEFAGGYHSLHSDIIRDEVMDTMVKFLSGDTEATHTN